MQCTLYVAQAAVFPVVEMKIRYLCSFLESASYRGGKLYLFCQPIIFPKTATEMVSAAKREIIMRPLADSCANKGDLYLCMNYISFFV